LAKVHWGYRREGRTVFVGRREKSKATVGTWSPGREKRGSASRVEEQEYSSYRIVDRQ